MTARSKTDGGVDLPDDKNYGLWSDEQIREKYKRLGVRLADHIVMEDSDPEDEIWFTEVQDVFYELAQRDIDVFPDGDR